MVVFAVACAVGSFEPETGASLAMLPMVIQKRFEHPKMLERAFMNYIKTARLEMAQGKTIASIAYYHQADISGVNSFRFFKDANGAENTNLTNSSDFQNPQSEHSVIWAIRIGSSIEDVNPDVAYYEAGTGSDGALQNANMTISNNGVIALQSYPLSEALDGLTTRDQGLLLMDEPFIWAAQSSMVCELRQNGGNNFSALQKVRITYIGLGLVS
jgi:hypothetical protein